MSDQLRWSCDVCNHSPLVVDSASITCSICNHQYIWKHGFWDCNDNFTPSSFPENRSNHLQEIEKKHFWFETRDQILRAKLLAFKRPNDHKLLELGCGSGRVLSTLAIEFTQTVGIEGHRSALKSAVENCPDSLLLHGNVLNTALSDEQFDWVVAFDVLEHVDPIAFLNEAFRLTRPGGRLLISVPAFPLLWSYVDEIAGHRCRYRIKQITKELHTTGWKLCGHTYFQFLLFPLLAISRLLNPRSQSKLERKPPCFVNKILHIINRLEIILFQRLCLPFGSSLIVWAEKPITTMTEQSERNTQY